MNKIHIIKRKKKSWLGWLPLRLCWQMLRELKGCEEQLPPPPFTDPARSGLCCIRGCCLPFTVQHVQHLSLSSSLAPLPAFPFFNTTWKIHTERGAEKRRQWKWKGVIRAKPDVLAQLEGPEKSGRLMTQEGQSKTSKIAYLAQLMSHTFMSVFISSFVKMNIFFSVSQAMLYLLS